MSTIDLLFDEFGLVCFANKNKNVSFYTANSKPVKQEVNGTVKLPPFSIPWYSHTSSCPKRTTRTQSLNTKKALS